MKIVRYPTQQMENGNTWTLVEVLDDAGKVVYSEDFIVQRQPVGSRIVTDEQGHFLMSDGSYLSPESLAEQAMSGQRQRIEPVRETFEVDIDAEIDAVIDQWLYRIREDGESVAEKLESGKLRGSRVDARAVKSLRQQPESWVQSLRSSAVDRAVDVRKRGER